MSKVTFQGKHEIQLNLIMSNSVYSKFRLGKKKKSSFKHNAFQLNLLLLFQILICQNFVYLEVNFSVPNIQIHSSYVH